VWLMKAMPSIKQLRGSERVTTAGASPVPHSGRGCARLGSRSVFPD
jgi:hypothetical protein